MSEQCLDFRMKWRWEMVNSGQKLIHFHIRLTDSSININNNNNKLVQINHFFSIHASTSFHSCGRRRTEELKNEINSLMFTHSLRIRLKSAIKLRVEFLPQIFWLLLQISLILLLSSFLDLRLGFQVYPLRCAIHQIGRNSKEPAKEYKY